MFELNAHPKVGSVPDFNGKKYGKIQITSQKLAQHAGDNLYIILLVFESEQELLKYRTSISPAPQRMK